MSNALIFAASAYTAVLVITLVLALKKNLTLLRHKSIFMLLVAVGAPVASIPIMTSYGSRIDGITAKIFLVLIIVAIGVNIYVNQVKTETIQNKSSVALFCIVLFQLLLVAYYLIGLSFL